MAGTKRSRNWEAWWIWGSPGLAEDHRNEYIYARHTFRLDSKPLSAPVRISACDRYQLFVNGKFVCRGPARCEPKYQAYDEIDLAPFLKQGRNCIAALAHHYGESTFQSRERGGWGFILDGQVRCQRGKPVPIHSGEKWKATRADAYSNRTARYVPQLGFQEDYDASAGTPDWAKPSLNDRDWPTAKVIGVATVMPFENLEARGIPFEREEPARFVSSTGTFTGRGHDDYRTCSDIGWLLAEEKRAPARTGAITGVDKAFKRGDGHMAVKPTPAGRFHAVVIDAGKETSGFVHFDIEAAGGEIVDFFYCEHVDADGAAIVRARNGGLAKMADRYRCRKGRQQHQFFWWKGFRYVLIVFRDVKRPLKLHHIGYTFTSYPVERRGSFECSDPLLNQIWETGVYTQQLCMHDAYMDCPWREQAQWWGDARIQWRVNMAAFGDEALFRRGIRQGAQSQVHDGLTYGLFPTDCHSCILPDYTLVWICSIWDYYFYTGDDSPLVEHFDNVVKALTWFDEHAGKSHLCGYPGAGLWLFLDWAPLFKGGYSATFSLQYLEALQTAAMMARHLDRTDEARRYAGLARKVEQAIVRTFWDPKGKQFFEGYETKKRKVYRQVAQHGNTYAILTGVQKKWHEKIIDRVVWIGRNFDKLAPDNVGGNYQHPKAKHPIASSFFYAYVLEAMFRMNRHADALRDIRGLWSRMLDNGATTWYESWDHGPESYGNTSACHAWSASPTYHLSEQVGGVMPIAPGFERVRIAPHGFDLDSARVRTPTPRGAIEIEWQRTNGTGMDLKIRLPKRIEAVLDVPGRRKQTLTGGTHRIQTKG